MTTQPIDEAGEEEILAALEVVRAFCIDHQAVGPVDGDDRAILPERPERQPLKRGCILGRRCVDHQEIGNHGLRLARRHADAQAEFQGCGIGSRDPALRSAPGDHDERLFSRQGFASASSDPLGRQMWEVDRYDPWHRGLQFQILRIRPL